MTVLFEVRGKKLVVGTTQIPLFPVGLGEFDWPIAHVFAIYLLQRIQKIIRITKGNKTIPPWMTRPPISNHSRHIKWTISAKHTRQNLIINLNPQITTKYTIVIFRPVLHRLVLPYFSRSFSHRSIILLLDLFYLLALICKTGLLFLLSYLVLFIFLRRLFGESFRLLLFGLRIDQRSRLDDCSRVYLFEFEHIIQFFIEKFDFFILGQLNSRLDRLTHPLYIYWFLL